MNKFLEYRLSDGEIIGIFETTNNEFDQVLRSGSGVVESDIDPSDGSCYVVDGILTIRPPKPTLFAKWNGSEWVDDAQAEYDFQAKLIRDRRNDLLTASDWTDTLSSKQRMGEETYNTWQAYRQALRDISDQPGFPFDVVWPNKPE